MTRFDYDFAIAGAGPCGSALGVFLARAGFRVGIFEKERFPRFQIGESLLPRSVPVLRDLGIDLSCAPFALKKEGARFVREKTGKEYRVSFSRTLPGCFPHAYQVERAQFDQALAGRAEEAGAELFFGRTVLGWREEENGVHFRTRETELSCRYLVDATGHLAMAGKTRKTRSFIRGMGRCATFSHYRKICSSEADDLYRTGDIIIMLTECQGWGWVIPLPGRRLSIGIVDKDGREIAPPVPTFNAFYESSKLLGTLLAGAVSDGPVRRRSNFGFYNREPRSARTVCAGDAHAFLDPVFSSGVTLALETAQGLAPHLTRAGREDSGLDLSEFHDFLHRGYNTFERIIERFYRPGWADTTIFHQDKPDHFVRQINTILAGDVWRRDNPYQEKLLAGKRRQIVLEPETVAPGGETA